MDSELYSRAALSTQADDLHSLLHDLDLSAPAVFVLGIQLQAAKFHRDLLSQVLLQKQNGNKNQAKETSGSGVYVLLSVQVDGRTYKVLVQVDVPKASRPKSVLHLPGAAQLALFECGPLHNVR